jgi:Domain of unknown function (DUF4336)
MNTLIMTATNNAAPCSTSATKAQIVCGLQRSANIRSLPVANKKKLNQRLAIRTNAVQQTEEITTPSTSNAKVTISSPLSDDQIQESRRYFSLLPPFFSRTTICEQISEGLWSLAQPLKPPGQADIRLRMVAARLDDGNLLLIGPIAPTAETMQILKQLGGEVTHVIVPNTSPEHWFYAPALADALPQARFWFCPGFFEGKGVPLPGRSLFFGSQRARGQCATLGVDALPSELQGQVKTILFDVPFFLEAAVCLPRHQVLLLADTAICLSADDPEYASSNVKMAEKMGIWDRLGPITRVVFERYPQQGKAWVEAVLSECGDWDVVVPAHGSAPVQNGRIAFKDCFNFLF